MAECRFISVLTAILPLYLPSRQGNAESLIYRQSAPENGYRPPPLQHKTASHLSRPVPETRPASAPPAPVFSNIAHRINRPGQVDAATYAFGSQQQQEEPLLARAQKILAGLPPKIDSHSEAVCEVCRTRPAAAYAYANTYQQQPQTVAGLGGMAADDSHMHRRGMRANEEPERLPMQTLISRELRGLEDDFASHKRWAT